MPLVNFTDQLALQFKMSIAKAMHRLHTEKYSLDDAAKEREPHRGNFGFCGSRNPYFRGQGGGQFNYKPTRQYPLNGNFPPCQPVAAYHGGFQDAHGEDGYDSYGQAYDGAYEEEGYHGHTISAYGNTSATDDESTEDKENLSWRSSCVHKLL